MHTSVTFQTRSVLFSTLVALVSISTTVCMGSKFYKQDTNRLLTSHRQFAGVSELGCCGQCHLDKSCHSVSYQGAALTCELSTVGLKDVDANSQTLSGWVTFTKVEPSDWMPVFHGISDIGTDVYQSWLTGTDVTHDDVNCMSPDSSSCSKHFRSRFVTFWRSFDAFEVKLSLYKNMSEVAYIIFDGTSSDLTSWFATERVVSSTWDVIKNASLKFFSVEGFNDARRFYINQYFGGCDSDPHVLLVLTRGGGACNYEAPASFPKILYSVSNTWANFYEPSEFDYADSMMLSIRIL